MQDDYDEIFGSAVKSAMAFFAMVLMLLMACAMCGCSTTKYVPVETMRTEYVDKVRTEVVTDSVSNDRFVYVKGDTVYVREWRDRWHTQVRTDTVVSVKTDSISVPYPVERELTRWERVKMDFGGLMLGAVGVLIVLSGILGWLAMKKRKV